jgi:RNA recognition motif-containing protein
MGRKLYVGNLSYDVTSSALEQMCAQYGTVESAQVIMDRDTGRSKGFGFVEMKTDQEAQAAIAGLNGQMSGGRSLTVNEAKPREDRGGGGRGFGGGAATGAAAAGGTNWRHPRASAPRFGLFAEGFAASRLPFGPVHATYGPGTHGVRARSPRGHLQGVPRYSGQLRSNHDSTDARPRP